jgi:hypothetical protein
VRRRSAAAAVASAALAVLVAACPTARQPPVPPGGSEPIDDGPAAVEPGPPETPGPVEPESARRQDGSPCLTASQCQSGLCEGLGCGADQPGRCVSRDRMCTADLVPYCGCDDRRFEASSSCPAARYQARGDCGDPGPSR